MVTVAETGERRSPDARESSIVDTIDVMPAHGATRLLATVAPYIAVLALGVGVWLRVVALAREGFWLDEIFSASFSNLSLTNTLLAVLMLDVHPPLYYLQLNLWGRFGHGDAWLLMNSVAWSTAAMLAAYYGTRHRFGALAGLLALAVCAVLGGEIYFAHELRMYPMASCLAVLSWIAADRVRNDYRFVAAIPLILILALLGAIHSASMIGATAALLYILPTSDRLAIRRRLSTWLAICAAVACSYVPWVINAASRDPVLHATLPSKPALIETIAGWLIGYGTVALPSWVPIGAAMFLTLGLYAAALVNARVCRIVLCYLVWPLVFAAVLSVTVQPIWLDRTFAFCAPFVAIAFGTAVAVGLEAAANSAHRGLVPAYLAVFCALVIAGGFLAYQQSATPNKPDHYRALARYLAANAAAHERIYAPRDVDFWGLNRYLIGPDWGSILQYQDPTTLQHRKRWRWLYARLGASELERLGAMPVSRRYDGFRLPIFVGESPLPQQPTVTGEWLVTVEGAPPPPPDDSHLCVTKYPAPIRFGRLELYHWSCPSGGNG